MAHETRNCGGGYVGDLRGIDSEGRRLVIHRSESAYNARRKDPGTFTVNELMMLAKKYGIEVIDLFAKSPYEK